MLVLSCFRMNDNVQIATDEEQKIQDVNDIRTELAEHISMAIAENSSEELSSDKATAGSKNIETLSKAYSQLEKAEAERLKVILQIKEAERRQWVNWDVVLPKLAAVGVTGAVTVFWICMEQGTPLPMRLVKMVSDLTLPRGL